ncbi:hypothetical protein BJ508DRAFT_412042 [Ascobolus immersus RN42]|uniref:Mitochondrial import inner membrane translocase subunit n=1 Tax=Ascobolus immersus RN42 TaxID=1160509 RepID=A0A3N4IGH4_ASCIM|nr:hypothetical protein BJ508DRAFT_412042 [Ascobolus immersus RN42]
MDAMDGFDNKTQQELQQFVENESSKAKLNGIIHDLTDRCWKKCFAQTSSISSGSLSSSENTCVKDCVGRWVDTSYLIVKSLEKMR